MEITDINQLDSNKSYSYADYLLWKFEERVELIKGKIFKMSPAPSSNHQWISSKLHIFLGNQFLKNNCKIFAAPFDVRLSQEVDYEKVYTVVQPDLCVVCDASKIDKKGCIGAPDLIIEILSPGNTKKEVKNKFSLYEEAGVKEYWIVYPAEQNIIINYLDNGKYKTLPPVAEGLVTSHYFPDIRISVEDVFEQ